VRLQTVRELVARTLDRARSRLVPQQEVSTPVLLERGPCAAPEEAQTEAHRVSLEIAVAWVAGIILGWLITKWWYQSAIAELHEWYDYQMANLRAYWSNQ